VTSTVFITGANGFIGRTLADHFGAAGHVVRGVDRTADDARRVVAGDTTRPSGWEAHLKGCEVLLHTAAVVSNAVDAATQWNVNVLGTRRVLEAAARAGVGRVVHLSSVRAYGDLGFPDGVGEWWPLRPDGHAYVDTKVAAEAAAFQAHSAGEVAVTVVRPGDVYGPRSRPWTVIPVEETRRGRLILPARGKGVFSPIYVDDLVDGIALAATHPAASGQAFNLTGPTTVSCAEFFGHYARMLGMPPQRTVPTAVAVALASAVGSYENARGRPSELNAETVRYLTRTGGYSRAKAQALLGWVPQISLDEGMRRTEAWLRQQGSLPHILV
jgi:nucleoside-diphosphate-sugar epimerase